MTKMIKKGEGERVKYCKSKKRLKMYRNQFPSKKLRASNITQSKSLKNAQQDSQCQSKYNKSTDER